MSNVTADTNILVSALVYKRGKPYQLLQMAIAGDILLTVSDNILEEMADVLVRKFKVSKETVEEAVEIVRGAARVIRPSVRLDVVKDDPDDSRILECALSGGSDFLVTGDKDLLRLKDYDSIRILTVAEFLALTIVEE